MVDHTALIERLKAATGADRELDGDIADALGLVPAWATTRRQRYLWTDGKPVLRARTWLPPKWTASVDACLALAESLLPGWTTRHHTANTSPLRWHFYMARHVADRDGVPSPHEFLGIGAPPIAILIAILTAHQSRSPA